MWKQDARYFLFFLPFDQTHRCIGWLFSFPWLPSCATVSPYSRLWTKTLSNTSLLIFWNGLFSTFVSFTAWVLREQWWFFFFYYLLVVMYIQLELRGCSVKPLVTLLLHLHDVTSSLEQTFRKSLSIQTRIFSPPSVVQDLTISRFFIFYKNSLMWKNMADFAAMTQITLASWDKIVLTVWKRVAGHTNKTCYHCFQTVSVR